MKLRYSQLLMGAAALFSSMAFAADKVTYQLDWLPGGDKAPVYVGIQQGYFAEENIEVKIASGRGSTDAVTKMATGQSDIGSADIGALMAARAQDKVPVSAVYALFTQAPHAFFVLSESKVESITDMAGKKVATSPFTSSNAFLPLVLEENDMSADAVKLTKTDPGALGPLLITGNADAIIAWVTNVALFEEQAASAGKKIRVLPWSDAGLELYSSSLVASDKFLSERPKVAQRFLKAFAKAVAFTQQNPEAAGKAIHAMVPEVDPKIAAAQIRDTMKLIYNQTATDDGFGVFTPERIAKTWKYVARANDLSVESLDPQSVVDQSVMPEAN